MPRKINIMQVTFGMGIGGMERVIMDLCRHVDPDRFRFSICCISVRGPLADEMEAEGVPVIYCENQSRVGKYFRGLELARIFRRMDVDMLHTHHTPAFVDSAIGARLAGVPVLVNTDHCKNYPIERRWVWAERAAASVADEVVAVSAHTRDELIRHEGLDPHKVSVIHNGIDLKMQRDATVEELRRELGLRPEERVIGSVARLEAQKGLDLLLDAAPLVLREVPDARFVLVGGGSLEGKLRDQAARLGLADRVLFTGWRRDAVDLLQGFDVFALSSTFEGMPMVLLEAMALSKPIVATAVGGVPEVVEDGATGRLVRSRSPEAYARALLEVVTDRGRAARMGQAGRVAYERRFTARAMAAAYESLYERCLGRKGVRAA